MKKVLDPKVHGVLDYGLAALFLILPGVLAFTDPAASVSYVIGIVYIITSLATKYPLGVIKLIPFPTHGVLETIMALAWLLFPWVFGFSGDAAARNFFIIAALALLGVVALTDYSHVKARYSRITG